MKLFRHIITVGCVVASFVANAGEQLTTNGKCAASQPTAVELQPLQGTWEGVMVGQEKDGKITITITGNHLHFHRDTNFWFETTIALPAGKDPKQLHATIKDCPRSQTDSIGKVVRAFFKIENGTLTLATIGDDAEETPKGFEAAGTRYELRKVQPQKMNVELPISKWVLRCYQWSHKIKKRRLQRLPLPFGRGEGMRVRGKGVAILMAQEWSFECSSKARTLVS